MMNEVELTEKIRERLKADLALLQLPSEKMADTVRPPQVVDGYLPPKNATQTPDFPYVIARAGDGQTSESGMSNAEVKLLIGCYSEDYDGHNYCLMVMSYIRRSLMQNPFLEDSAFRFELPFSWKMFDDQPYPEWILEITTQWSVPTPQQIPDEGVL